MSDFISHHLSCFIPSWHLWTFLHACVCAQFGLALCDPMGCSLPGSSVHGIFQARILERVAISYSQRSSQPRVGRHLLCLLHWQADPLTLPPRTPLWTLTAVIILMEKHPRSILVGWYLFFSQFCCWPDSTCRKEDWICDEAHPEVNNRGSQGLP